jgi:hypothetical protein
MPEHQPEADAASELDGDGKERLREHGDDVLVGADRLGHAGGLRVGLLYGLLLVNRIDGSLGCGNLGVEPRALDGCGAVLLGHQQGRTRVALLALTLPAKVPAAAPGAFCGCLLGCGGDGCKHVVRLGGRNHAHMVVRSTKRGLG